MRGKKYERRFAIGCFSVSAVLACVAISCVPLLAQRSTASTQTDTQGDLKESALAMSSVATRRFVASHGRRALVMGYPEDGLEVWAYPLQILAGYQIGFRPEGATSETDGRLLLSRVIERPDSITRIYTGPYYVVRERLFVPLDEPAAILSYEVDTPAPVEIIVHFTPVLDLMWPGSLGGQEVGWNQNLPGYLLAEPIHKLSAFVASPEMNSHDAMVNSTVHAGDKLSFSIRPRIPAESKINVSATATVYVALVAKDKDPAATLRSLSAQKAAFEVQAVAHYASLERQGLRIETPDDDVNSALAWAEVALDQAWVCNPQLGCGIVAGYGPSRPGRRPQFAWFFAGDGLVATQALISAGEYSRARDELEFIAKYQDAKTGMVWHELTQSAGYLDWEKYIYMFAHVDISFDYLNVVSRYVAVSADAEFAKEHWQSIAAAYQYCRSLVVATDNLPHITPGKEGGDEQHRPEDDLGLSSSWVMAAQSFAQLAASTGHAQMANDAEKESQLVRSAVAEHYWDAAHNFWIDSHSAGGEPALTRSSGPGEAIVQDIFSPGQNEQLLDQIASAKFQTDWGTRHVSSDSAIYNPLSYATGSISALHSANTAATFWQEHRPGIAWPIWQAILPWNTLDALGHLHEVLAGNLFREQTESVPEQTWSSAGVLDSAVRGLLGMEVSGAHNKVLLRPHVPPEWDRISVRNVRLPHSTLAFNMTQSERSLDLEIKNDGGASALSFAPEIPLGARISRAEFGGRKIAVNVEEFGSDEHARVEIQAPPGTSHCHIDFTGGVSLFLPRIVPRVGDPSTGMKVTHLQLRGRNLSIDADVHPVAQNTFRIRTPWKVAAVKNATIQTMPENQYDLKVHAQGNGYSSVHIEISFTER